MDRNSFILICGNCGAAGTLKDTKIIHKKVKGFKSIFDAEIELWKCKKCHEINLSRIAISKILKKHKNVVVVEGECPKCHYLNQYILFKEKIVWINDVHRDIIKEDLEELKKVRLDDFICRECGFRIPRKFLKEKS